MPARGPVEVPIREESIRLGQFLKLADLAETGSDAKDVIVAGAVLVNGEPETRRGRQLRAGDVVELGGRQARVARLPAARVRYRTFTLYNALGGLIWGVGYVLLGYLAGSAYAVIEREVGAGLAIAIGVLVVAAIAVWLYRRHRSAARARSSR